MKSRMQGRGRVWVLASLLAVMVLVPGLAAAQDAPEKSWSVSVGYDHANVYLFRGLDLLAGEPVHIPHVYATFGSFSAYYYGYRGDIGDGGPTYAENDFGLEYACTLGKTALTLGGVAYTYQKPEDFPNTTEVYGIASWDVIFSPKLSVYYDVDQYDSGYANLAFSHAQDLGHDLTLTPSASYGYSLGWTHRALGFDNHPNAANDVLLGLDLGWSKGALSLHAAAQKSIARAALQDVDQGDLKVYTIGGAYSF